MVCKLMTNLVTGSQCRYLKVTGVHLWYSNSPMLHCSSFVSSWFEPLCLRFFNLRKFSNRRFTFVVCQDGHVTLIFFFFCVCSAILISATLPTSLDCYVVTPSSCIAVWTETFAEELKSKSGEESQGNHHQSSLFGFPVKCVQRYWPFHPETCCWHAHWAVFVCRVAMICMLWYICSYSSLALRYLSRLEGTVFQQPLVALCTNLVMGL